MKITRCFATVIACVCMAVLPVTAVEYYYWTNATGDGLASTANNWQDEAGNVYETPPLNTTSSDAILVFTNATGVVRNTAAFRYYGYVFKGDTALSISDYGGSDPNNNRDINIFGGGVTHEGTGNVRFGYSLYFKVPTNSFNIVNENATVEFNNSLYGSESLTMLKQGKGTIRMPVSSGSTVNNIKEVIMQGGTWAISSANIRTKLTNCTITFDGNDPSSRIKRMINGTTASDYTTLPLTGGCIRETETVDNTEHGFTDDGNAFTLSLTDNVKSSRFTGTIYSKLSFLWGPNDGSQTFTFAKATHPTTGSLTVTNGTVRLENGAKFKSLSAVTVKSGATLDVASGIDSAIRTGTLTIESGATLRVAANTSIDVSGAVTVGGVELSDGLGVYTEDNCDWVTGDGKVVTSVWPSTKPDTVWNRRDYSSTLEAGTETWYKGAELDGNNLELTAGEGASVVMGSLGVKTYGNGKTYTWGWPTYIYGTQEWVVTNNDVLVISAPVESAFFGDLEFTGKGAVTFAVDQNSDTPFVFRVPAVYMNGVTIGNPITSTSMIYKASSATVTNTFMGRVTMCGSHSITNATWRFAGGADGIGDASINMLGDTTVIVDTQPFKTESRFYYRYLYLNVPSNNVASVNHASCRHDNSFIRAGAPYALWRGPERFDARGNQRLSLGFFCATQNKPEDHEHHVGCTLDLGGFDQEISSLACSTNDACVTSASPAQLHYVLDAITQNQVFGFVWYSVTNYVHFTGGAGLTYEGSRDDMMLVETSATTGRLEVASGKLTIAAPGGSNVYTGLAWPGGSWPNASEVSASGGTLVLEHSNAIGRDTDVSVSGGGQLEISAGAMVRCRDLYFDGERQKPGVWGGPESPAPAAHKSSRLAGAGVLVVLGDGLGTMMIFR